MITESTPVNQNINELWLKMARAQYPGKSDAILQEMKIDHAVDWACEIDNEKATLYDKYVMMKKLLDITPKEDN